MRRLLVANRGEIARRIFRTCRRLGIETVAVYSTIDAGSSHVGESDMAVELPGAPDRAYLDVAALVAAARRTAADAVHPGYGFLAESPSLAEAVAEAGAVFVGPPPEVMAAMGDKIEALSRARDAGVPVLAGTSTAVDPGGGGGAKHVSYPALVKAAAGGGGRGMRRVDHAGELGEAIEAASREAEAVFGDGRVYLEPLVPRGRHVEVQVFGDRHGGVVHLYERDCSVQRRHQKVIEESLAPGLDSATRTTLLDAATRLAKSIGYVGAGTVEFLVTGGGTASFLEMNTRLQVEHPVTEAVTGLDLVELQIRVADGEALPAQDDIPAPSGHAVEARIVAEDPIADDAPQVGRVLRWEMPAGVRVDAAVTSGDTVSPYYDSLLGKVIAHAPDRRGALGLLATALTRSRIHGIATNRDLLVAVLRHPRFVAGDLHTGFLDEHGADVRRSLLPDEVKPAAVAAAVVAAADASRLGARVMQSIPSGWRNLEAVPQTRTYESGGVTVEVAYRMRRDRADVTVDGDGLAVEVHGVAGEEVDITVGGIRRCFLVARYEDHVHVDGGGGSLALVEQPRFPPAEGGFAEGSLTAPLPGTVVAVRVGIGDEVAAGDPLVVMETMKMEHTVIAPHRGIVTAVASIGEQVEAGDAVVSIHGGSSEH